MGQVKGTLVRVNTRLINTPAPQIISTSTTQAMSGALGTHEVMILSDAASYIREDTDAALTATPVTSANGHYIPANTRIPMIVDPGNKIGIITLASTGHLYISNLG